MNRILKWISSPFAAQVGAFLLMVIAVRWIGDFFRLGGSVGAQLTGEQVFYVGRALAAACAALIALVLHTFGRHAATVAFTLAAIVGLIVWKVAILY